MLEGIRRRGDGLFEDQCQAIAERARCEAGRGSDSITFPSIVEEFLRSNAEVVKRWLEVTQAIIEQQQQTNAVLLNLLDELKKQKGLSS